MSDILMDALYNMPWQYWLLSIAGAAVLLVIYWYTDRD